MRNFYYILKVQFLSAFAPKKSSKFGNAKGLTGALVSFLLLGVVLVAFGYLYSKMLAESMIMTNTLNELVPIMVAVSSLVCLLLSFYSTGTVLFGQKDYEFLASLPVKKTIVVLAKVAYMYLSDLLFILLFCIPSTIVYYQNGVVVVWQDIVRFALTFTFAPLLPLAVSVIFGTLVSYISSLFKRKNIVQLILYALFFVACFGAGFATSFVGEEQSPTVVFDVIKNIYPVYPIILKGLFDWAYFAIFLAISIASFAVVVTLVTVFYRQINTLLTSKRTSKNYKMKALKGKRQFGALFAQEMKRLFAYPIYAINCLMGAIMTLLFGIIIMVVIRLLLVDGSEIGQAVFMVLMPFYPAVTAFTLMMAPTTSCSISLEGSSLWIMQTSPVSKNKLFNAKLLLNVVFNVIPSVIVGIILVIVVRLPFVSAMLIVLITAFQGLLSGNIGLLANLVFPKLKWDNPNQVVKQGFAVLICIILSFLFTIAFGLIGYFVGVNDFVLGLLIVLGITVTFAVSSYLVILKFGDKILAKRAE